MIDFERMTTRLPEHAADAILGMLRPKSRTLTNHLRATWGAPAGTTGSLLAEPLIEGAFPWQPLEGGWDGLGEGVLDSRTIEILKTVAFPPYEHQADAWTRLTSLVAHDDHNRARRATVQIARRSCECARPQCYARDDRIWQRLDPADARPPVPSYDRGHMGVHQPDLLGSPIGRA